MAENLQQKIAWILQEKYRGKLTGAAKRDILRLKRGEPLDYIIGFVEFLDCKIDLSQKPLIPRIETEFWVEQAIKQISSKYASLHKHTRVLDLFAGSGCIGLAIMRHVRSAHVTFADSEKNTLRQIALNAKLNRVSKSRYGIITSDVFGSISGKFDYIFANPPYIPVKNAHKVQKSVIAYEPKAALFGGNDGLWFVNIFLKEAKNFLNKKGKIFMEFDPPQKGRIEKLLKKHGYEQWEFNKDQFGKWRWVVTGQ